MTIKVLTLAAILVLALAETTFEEEKNVLILNDGDIDAAIKEFPKLLIEFYAPWCGHCKKLAPVYDEVAGTLKKEGSSVRLAKIDCDTHSKAKGKFKVGGFPTLIYFDKGTQVKYDGQRSADFMTKWLLKKERPAVTQITAEQLEEIKSNGKVSVVFYGDIESTEGQQFSKAAISDDYNDYYSLSGTANNEGSADIFRSFAEATNYAQVDAEFKAFVLQNDRPIVLPFDDRTIASIFSSGGSGIFLFNANDDAQSTAAFAESAKSWRESKSEFNPIFSEIPQSNSHLKDLANYLKINTDKSPIVFINGKERIKNILVKSTSELSAEGITDFMQNLSSQKSYKLDEEVKYEKVEATQEEL